MLSEHSNVWIVQDCQGWILVIRKQVKIFINEINTLPGFTQISMYPKLWAESGIPYAELIDKLIELAFERFEDTRREYTNSLD